MNPGVMINPGELRNAVTVQRKSVTRDDHGGEVVTWTTFASVWAAILPISGREYIEARQQQGDLLFRVIIRYLAGITSGMRVAYGSRVLEIEAVLDVEERHNKMVLMCVEKL